MSRTIRILLIALATVICGEAQASEWRIVLITDPLTITFVDIDSMIKAADGTIGVWSETIDAGLNDYKSRQYYRCQSNEVGVQTFIGTDGKGKVRENDSKPDKDVAFKPVPPNSSGERTEAMVCAENPRAYGIAHEFPSTDREPLPFMTEYLRLQKEKLAATAASGKH